MPRRLSHHLRPRTAGWVRRRLAIVVGVGALWALLTPTALGGDSPAVVEFRTEIQPIPLCNLDLSMMERIGGKTIDRFGDSTGRPSNL
jgi:hypothetical protein